MVTLTIALEARHAEELEAAAKELEQLNGSWSNAASLLRQAAGELRQGERKSLTTGEVAGLLGVTDQTIRNWVDLGWLPSEEPTPGGHRRIPLEAIEPVLSLRAARRRVSLSLTDEAAAELVRRHRTRRQSSGTEVARGS